VYHCAGRGYEKFGRTYPTHAPAVFDGKGFTNYRVNFVGDLPVSIGNINEHLPWGLGILFKGNQIIAYPETGYYDINGTKNP
jgi:hypothetical protein